MKHLHTFLLLLFLLLGYAPLMAQTDTIRYVKTDGSYAGDGRSWRTAKSNLQDAINDLHAYLQKYSLKSGRIYVAKGTYKPTESTETQAGGVLYTAFKMYPGIRLYGGYQGNETDCDPAKRLKEPDASKAWQFLHQTILSGDHSSSNSTAFTWNATKEVWNTVFPGNSYHVLWFATNGFDAKGQARPLVGAEARVDGFIIQGGHAASTSEQRMHTSFGGGVYMTQGARLQNCIVRLCAATRRGGGVYLDGGGEVDRCYVHTCQSLGVGISDGYGGGICVEGSGRVRRTLIHNNVGRLGGGITLSEERAEEESAPDEAYRDVVAAGCIVSNNVATTEAGGMLMLQGGVANHMTIVRNKCTGPDVMIGSRRYGQSHGLFISKSGFITNSAIWGNGARPHGNVEYAAYIESSTSTLRPTVTYTAISNHELVNWTGTSKRRVLSLEEANSGPGALTPNFKAGGVMANVDAIPMGVDLNTTNPLPSKRWMPAGTSPLREAGVMISNYSSLDARQLSHLGVDIEGKDYLQLATLGAYVPDKLTYVPRLMPSLEGEPNTYYLTFFVDPRAVEMDRTKGDVGASWDCPIRYINGVVRWMEENEAAQTFTYYNEKGVRVSGHYPFQGKPIQVVVKEGTLRPVGQNLMGGHGMRSSYFRVRSHMRFYGSVPTANKATDLSNRNFKHTPTTLSANLISNGFDYNACHLVAYEGASHTIMDGFRIAYGNTSAGGNYNPKSLNGSGIVVTGTSNLLNNKVRNCVVANNQAQKGSALFVRPYGQQVEFAFENCIFHNNTCTLPSAGGTIHVEPGNAAKPNKVHLTFSHCDILQNVGHALWLRGSGVTVDIDNSIIWANASGALGRVEDLASTKPQFYVLTSNTDKDVTLQARSLLLDAGHTLGGVTGTLTYKEAPGVFTYPLFVNPTKNVGHTQDGDLTFYGGVPNFTPQNMSPLVNASTSVGFDMALVARSYGGAADIGALENTLLPADGKVIYVRDYGNATEPGGDGSCWAKAINGNCTNFTSNHDFKGYDAEPYAAGTSLTGLQWAVDEAYRRSLQKQADGTILYKNQTGVWKNGAPNQTIQYSTVQSEKRVQVWVAQGEYLRRQGFVMRNGVDTYGGFIATGNPGMDERNPKKYQTIIQTNTDAEIKNGTFSWGNPIFDGGNRVQNQAPIFTPVVVKPSVEGGATHWYFMGVNNGGRYYATSQTYATQSFDLTTYGQFAFYPAGRNGEYYIKCRDARGTEKWLGYSRGIGNGSGFLQVVDLNNRKPFHVNSSSQAYQIYVVSSSWFGTKKYYFNWHGGPLQNTNTSIGLYDQGTDAGSLWFFYDVNEKPIAPEDDYFTSYHYELNTNYDYACASRRVLTQPYPYYQGTNNHECEFGNKPYTTLSFSYQTMWNGFVIQNGRARIRHPKDGGAGLALRHNGVVENCVIRHNRNSSERMRGGAIFCNGGVIANCEVIGNIVGNDARKGEAYGGGLYMRAGTSYNTSYIANEEWGEYQIDGAACFFEDGLFYNNTIVGNKGDRAMSTIAWFDQSYVDIYNCIVYGNQLTTNEAIYLKGKTGFNIQVDHCLFSKEIDYKIDNRQGAFIQIGVNKWGDPLFKNPSQGDYSLLAGSPAINMGTDQLLPLNQGTEYRPLTLPSYDAIYAPRIQDCTVDIGAYEHNGAYSIAPQVAGTVATFYVTQNGAGTASAANPANAACMQKLQQVLDAAGRYKYLQPGQQVIVKLAAIPDGFYAPIRSAVLELGSRERKNPRTYSLMVPRGVEVWGGYTEDFLHRDILKNKTVLSGAYTADGQNVNCYHIVTFTDDLFNSDGVKIGEGYAPVPSTRPEKNPSLAQKETQMGIHNRAILDGLYLEGGDASGEVTEVGEDDKVREKNRNRYGGVAIVPDYGHVRRCVMQGNKAANGGGALFLENGALVSGCILTQNNAQQGGAVYVKQEPHPMGVLPDLSYQAYAHICGCTMVDNQANEGGGIWFNDNVRILNTVIWGNKGNNGANVIGVVDPFNTAQASPHIMDYPFAFSAVQDIKMPGINTIPLATDVNQGVRFVDLNVDPAYALKRHSVLVRAGAPLEFYKSVREFNTNGYGFPTLETEDIAGKSLFDITYTSGTTPVTREKDFMEIGARAYGKLTRPEPSLDRLMTRLFVVSPQYVDGAAFDKMEEQAKLGGAQEGSTFAYPMQSLDDALYYIQEARKRLGNQIATVTLEKVNPAVGRIEPALVSLPVCNIPFEIFVGKGTYTPSRTVTGEFKYSRGNTFLIPEGVSVYGGFDTKTSDGAYYGSLVAPNEQAPLQPAGITVKGELTKQILRSRELTDLNANSVFEPWEMKNQTILSGKNNSSHLAQETYHVITCMADPSMVGVLPDTGSDYTRWTEALKEPDPQKRETLLKQTPQKRGLPVTLNGLTIREGNALSYRYGSVVNANSYYKGGGVLVDGNWVAARPGYKWENGMVNDPEVAKRLEDRKSVGRRNIPLVVHSCDFTDNRAGTGGAIYSNGAVQIYSSNFSQNAAKYTKEDLSDLSKLYPLPPNYKPEYFHGCGNGGAVFTTFVLNAVNTIFVNNEAGAIEDAATDLDELTPNGPRGGALYHGAGGPYGSTLILNCNFVRNRAVDYPAIYMTYANLGGLRAADNPHKIMNSIFWGNELRVPQKMLPGYAPRDFVVNFYNRSGKNPTFVTSKEELLNEVDDANGNPTIGEMLWFCAYEEGRGRKPRYHKDKASGVDYRKIPFTLNTKGEIPYIPELIDDYGVKVNKDVDPWVNHNIILNKSNVAVDGPNFVSPSVESGIAGYRPSADWMMARQNNLTDNGWTYIEQEVVWDNTKQEYTCAFKRESTTQGYKDYSATGIYADLRDLYPHRDDEYKLELFPLGEEKYMQFAPETKRGNMLRISKDPNPSQYQTYIDLGVYEYQHTPLNIAQGKDVDVLWVNTYEKPENGPADGSSWHQPTSDLQRAIETLLSSRNGNHKQINIVEGEYSPNYTIDDKLCFSINTGSLNPSASGDGSVRSLRIIGGWSKDIANQRDKEETATIIKMSTRAGVGEEKLTSVFRITDAHNWHGYGIKARPYVAGSSARIQSLIPITIEGLTLMNTYGNSGQEGASLHYAPQYDFKLDATGKPQKGPDGFFVVDRTKPAPALDGAPKLKLHQVKAMLNGTPLMQTPAVTIGEGGGFALVYNSLFHSNNGRSLVGVDTRVLNCTFALNQAGLQLTGTASALHNSILWKNGSTEYELPAAAPITDNAISTSLSASLPQDNDGLSPTNSDIIRGPNFVNPMEKASTPEEKMKRDFHLSPSARTISKGDSLIYINKVYGSSNSWTGWANEKDLALAPRKVGKGLERGAYEYQSMLQRVVYVNPKNQNSGDGKSWAMSMGYHKLRDAIDLAAVYSNANNQTAYVFCKGGATPEQIVARHGVQVYGSINDGFTSEAKDESGANEDERLNRYVKRVLSDRLGVAAVGASPTVVNLVRSNDSKKKDVPYALLDGFVVDGGGVDLTANSKVVLRNAVVRNVSHASGSVVNVQQGLLYNVLVRDSKAGSTAAVTHIGSNGAALNCTFLSEDGQQKALQVDQGGKVAYAITWNNATSAPSYTGLLTQSNQPSEGYPFARYLQKPSATHPHPAAPAKYSAKHDLWYQLEEHSLQMDEDTLATDVAWIKDFASFVNVHTDRDLLGNPRLLNDKLDRGCYETWNVLKGGRLDAIAGQRFPQEGAVVYVHEGGKLILNQSPDGQTGEVLKPGYLLLAEGASLYGQGVQVQLSHVGVERTVGTSGALVALPYTWQPTDVRRIHYDATGHVQPETLQTPEVKAYNGAARAAYDYVPVATNSALWQDAAVPVSACEGRYFHPHALAKATCRFTAASEDVLYAEGGEQFKTVTLQQHDNRKPADAPHFTVVENMGWNLVGAPYLVAQYPTFGEGWNPGNYPMSLPRMLYTMNVEGGFQAFPSWTAGSSVSPGEAFFTQTAVKEASEALTFQLPTLSTSSVRTRAAITLTDGDGRTDEVQLAPAADEASWDYTYGRDALKWMAFNDSLPQTYVCNSAVEDVTHRTRFALLGAAPVGEEICLGVHAGSDEQLTFALSDVETYAAYQSVWLTDYSQGVVTNLLEAPYVAHQDAGTGTQSRYTVKLGGTRPQLDEDLSPHRHQVSGRDGHLCIAGLVCGERIKVYDASGRLMHEAEATSATYRTPLRRGVYVVRIEKEVYKLTIAPAR